jgi:hypothetical protein
MSKLISLIIALFGTLLTAALLTSETAETPLTLLCSGTIFIVFLIISLTLYFEKP